MMAPGSAGMIDKQVKDLAAAVAGIGDGGTVLLAGFGQVGEPVELVHALLETGARDLTVVANNAGTGEAGLARLIKERRVRKVICSFPRTTDSHCFEEAYAEGRIELELVPQGTLSERMRAAGAGLAGFYVRTGAETRLAEGKETRMFDGRLHVLEKPLKGDVALVKALKADRWGNLVYRKSARNFNPVVAMAADLVIAQVGEIVALGALDPEAIATPSIFVDRVVEVRA
jgi:3-oxoadipate CoA-transferase, alpha subunit